ncbi:MAG: 3-deoxy-D-manno-octulosonic acid transferase [Bacteroidetes bacterium HGW-Bacteroidetes-6]|jgi:3-deoxy-D-manno-octulosonic-acid transferase|nr:MAG: 3-deoxy-D-manno-octulosonic acid transferase [Bacteroidetes bacterium HGW-Bacteroidetes-6]
MRFFYSVSIQLYIFAIRLAAVFGNKKAQLWLYGRKQQRNEWRRLHLDREWIWFHVSSLGEFEQGRSLIEHFRSTQPDKAILLTFFSPSGFEIRKNYSEADLVLYLPADTRANAKRLLKNFNIEKAFFVKYDFWFNYLNALHKNRIPLYLVSGIFRREMHFFKWYGSWQRKQLKSFTRFFIQNETSLQLLKDIGFDNVTLSGDTRFDRVVHIASEAKSFLEIEQFIQGRQVYMAGSSWEPDEKYICRLIELHPEIKFIIVPHEIDDARIARLQKMLPCNSSLYTECSQAGFSDNQVLIINTIGMLSSLYRYATIAHIGNGFGSGIHNTLEAAVYGIPVIFGPNYHKFQEAADLIESGGGFSFADESEYLSVCESLLGDFAVRQAAAQAASNYVASRSGATAMIVHEIEA